MLAVISAIRNGFPSEPPKYECMSYGEPPPSNSDYKG